MKINKLLVILSLGVITVSSSISSGFASSYSKVVKKQAIGSGSQTIYVLNLEDYIYEQNIEEGYDAPDLVVQFEEYAKSKGYTNAKVVYETTDTNETMYNELLTGKNSYDVMCTSDYMIQKMANENLLEPLDRSLIPNYTKYVSDDIGERLDNIELHIDNETKYVKDYSIGYMWGTLGLLFNPNFKTFVKRNIAHDEVIEDMRQWSTLWDDKYKRTISIKDSVRDTYATGLLYTYDEELKTLRESWLKGKISDEQYNAQLNAIFNRCDNENIAEIKNSLNLLKKNIFGLEVDSGKQDIVTGKIGINLAWSGDAVYSMNQAEDATQVGTNIQELWYALPETGANIWFDGWIMPKNKARSQAQYELVHLFLDFISHPDNAAQNMDYIGYTSFIGGDSVLDLVRKWYDKRVTIDEETGESTFNKTLFDDSWEKVDLSYFFNGTLDKYSIADGDAIFYSDCYLPLKDQTGNISAGRQFFCQYPDENTIKRCAVMEDYKEQNSAILRMWEDFKSDPLPLWALILFIVEIVLIVSALAFYLISKKMKKVLRNKRKETYKH